MRGRRSPAAAVVLPPLATLHDEWKAAMAESRAAASIRRSERERKQERETARRLDEAQQRATKERHRAEAEAAKNRPVPTKAEHVALAKATYDQKLHLLETAGLAEGELRAAREKAKQDYLKDLNGVL